MAIADMFLKVQGVTGEASDMDHKGEIEVMSWSWGMDAPASVSLISGESSGMVTIGELNVVKRVDLSSPTLMGFLRNRKAVASAQLVVRKAGTTPLEYLKIELEKVRVNGLMAESSGSELVEHVRLGFEKVKVTYTPQSTIGARGGGANTFEADVHRGGGS